MRSHHIESKKVEDGLTEFNEEKNEKQEHLNIQPKKCKYY